jgi:hypothetical protein
VALPALPDDLGDGLLRRIITEVQRRHWDAPDESGLNGAPNHRGSKHG